MEDLRSGPLLVLQGTCLTGEGTACPRGLESFNEQAEGVDGVGPLEKLFQTEEQTTTRYILSGRR